MVVVVALPLLASAGEPGGWRVARAGGVRRIAVRASMRRMATLRADVNGYAPVRDAAVSAARRPVLCGCVPLQ